MNLSARQKTQQRPSLPFSGSQGAVLRLTHYYHEMPGDYSRVRMSPSIECGPSPFHVSQIWPLSVAVSLMRV